MVSQQGLAVGFQQDLVVVSRLAQVEASLQALVVVSQQGLAADFLLVPVAASQRALAIIGVPYLLGLVITGALCPRTLMTNQSVIVLR